MMETVMISVHINAKIMNKKFIFIIYSFVISVNLLNAQIVTIKDLYGKWSVSDWIILNITQQTPNEKKEFEKQKKKCLKSKFTIDSVAIKNNCSECEFSLCTNPFMYIEKINELPIVEDTEDTKRYPGNEIEESNFIGKTFARLLDKNYSGNKILVIKTNCKTYSQSNIRIFIINKSKIGLYSGEDLIILVRKQ